MTIPPAGRYIWDWYFNLSDRLRRIQDSAAIPIPPSEYVAWLQATGNIVYSIEYGILCDMDRMYCETVGQELTDYHKRLEEKSK